MPIPPGMGDSPSKCIGVTHVQSMSRKKPALGLDPRVETGFPKKDMLKQSDGAG